MATSGAARINRDFDEYYEDEDEMLMPSRPANVPMGRGMRQPTMNGMPTYRTMGEGIGQATARTAVASNVPQPIPGAGVRPRAANVPIMAPPAQRALAPTRQQMTDSYARPNPRRNMLPNVGAGLLNAKLGMFIGATLAVFVLGFFLVSNVIQWWSTWQDDMTYGRPRTSQIDAWVGHNEQTGTPTHFIAQNLNRQVVVYEIPGGDATKTRIIQGPPLYFKDSELAPVTLSFKDENADGHVDMIIHVEGQQFIFINDNGTFRRITDEERARLNLSAADNGGNK